MVFIGHPLLGQRKAGQSAAATAVLSNVVCQGVDNVTGQQSGFSWARAVQSVQKLVAGSAARLSRGW